MADLRRLLPPLAALAVLACTAGARAETTPAPLLTPKPVFVPGMYETESPPRQEYHAGLLRVLEPD